MTQQQMLEVFLPQIEQISHIYGKFSLVLARPALLDEYIETWTADGLETRNYAKNGDFVVKNLQTEFQEEYIVSSSAIYKRYKLFYFTENGAVLIPKGKIKGIVHSGEDFEFIAKWGQLMIVKTGDYLVCPFPECDEIYRIARQEFYETYEKE
jgi:hypothetical protein